MNWCHGLSVKIILNGRFPTLLGFTENSPFEISESRTLGRPGTERSGGTFPNRREGSGTVRTTFITDLSLPPKPQSLGHKVEAEGNVTDTPKSVH